MKKTNALLSGLLLLLLTTPAFAQEETFFGGKISAIGAYAAPIIRSSEVGGAGRVVAGGEAALLVNHSIILGVSSSRVMMDMENRAIGDTSYSLSSGGVLLGYAFKPMKKMHLVVRTVIGGGTAALRDNSDTPLWHNGGHGYFDNMDFSFRDLYFTVEPGLDLELNLARYFRVAIGLSYRYVTGINRPEMTVYIDDKGAGGISADLRFKFGRF